jgi:hypothetical protein
MVWIFLAKLQIAGRKLLSGFEIGATTPLARLRERDRGEGGATYLLRWAKFFGEFYGGQS